MITTKQELKHCLDIEKKLYIRDDFVSEIKLWILQDSEYLLWHYVKMLRYTEYHFNAQNRIRYLWYQRRKNIEGAKLGISIFHNCFDIGLRIYHYGNIVVNSNARIGKDCKLHGNNCIGNKGELTPYDVPTLGDNVELGVGSVILGNINIGDNIIIGANSVVVKPVEEDSVIVGIPAHVISGGKE